jgi:hypothetical protein
MQNGVLVSLFYQMNCISDAECDGHTLQIHVTCVTVDGIGG